MKLGAAFPSDYIKAEDLNGQQVTLSISNVEMDGIGKDKDQKLVIAFSGAKKKMVCNKTNAKTIAGHYGDDTDMWIGQKITIMPREVEFQGDMVWSIRVSLQKPGAPNAKPAPVLADNDGGLDPDGPGF